MIQNNLFLLSLLFLICCSNSENDQELLVNKDSFSARILSLDTFSIQSSIRAIAPIDSNTCYFAGSNGMIGKTVDGGKSWLIDSIQHPEHENLQFRSIAKTKDYWYVMSIASPAVIYRAATIGYVEEGRHWEMVYYENDSLAFYDSMAFWDDREGIAMGDPTDGCLSVVKTIDGGRTWNKLSCDLLPASAKGEAAFAASNSNIALVGNHVWMVSGGLKSRVFHSADRGENWEVFETPIIQGEQMTGIFSCDFLNEKEGYIFGGNWEDPEFNTANKAYTKDGGKTWTLVTDSLSPGYRSCIEYLDNKGNMLAVGFPGMSASHDFGKTWEKVNDEAFYTARSTENGKVIWLAGKNKVARMLLD